MRVLLIHMMFLSTLLPAQPAKKFLPPTPLEFYALYALNPDSAESPALFYTVYNWLGTKYKYAGKTKKGIDCSSFAGVLYDAAYCITLSGGSRDIYPTLIPVVKEELCEGDLVFFRIKRGQISHVGVYLGNNKFAHASVKKGVMINDLDEAYYRKYFYTGGRVPPKQTK